MALFKEISYEDTRIVYNLINKNRINLKIIIIIDLNNNYITYTQLKKTLTTPHTHKSKSQHYSYPTNNTTQTTQIYLKSSV
jgi:hypothetical protein